jgi:uncharacterized membrane protein
MIKRSLILLLFLAVVSVASGYLMSESRLIGKVGISIFHKEYGWTKIWWQGAAIVFTVQLALFFLHFLLRRLLPFFAGVAVHVLMLLAACAGLYFTYNDFQDDFTHRWMGHHFHAGFYLVWVGWMITAIFFLTAPKKKKQPIFPLDEDAPQEKL